MEGLFEASDDDKSGYIDEREFGAIMVACCTQITSRLLVYFMIIIVLVPIVAARVIDVFLAMDDWMDLKSAEYTSVFSWVEKLLTWGEFAGKVVSLVLFFLVVPLFFNWIDSSATQAAAHIVVADRPEDPEAEEKKKE